MKKTLLLIALILATTGCDPKTPSYTPVDWNSNTTPPPFTPQPPKPQPTQPTSINQQLLDLHNHERETKGRPSLDIDPQLTKYAQDHADWMAQRSNLQHSNISNVIRLGNFMTAGENIAWNQQTPQEVTNAWMHSTGHRDNILNRKFTKVGFGVGYNSRGEPYWCTCFGG